MKKIIALLCFATLSVPTFALNARSLDESIALVKEMASRSVITQTGNIEPAIAGMMDDYHAGAKTYVYLFLAEVELTFADGEKITLGEYLDKYAHAKEVFATFKNEIKNAVGDRGILAQGILETMADYMKKMTDEEAAELAKRYVNYRVNGCPLVTFVRNPEVNWDGSALDELAAFGDRIERLAK